MDNLYETYQFARHVIQLEKVSLEKSFVEKFMEISGDEKLHNDVEFSFKIEILSDKSSAHAFLKTNLNTVKLDTQDTVLATEVIYRGLFSLTDSEAEITTDDLLEFIKIQVVPQLIPYTRSHLLMVTSQMLQEPINLPTLDIIESMLMNKGE